MATGAAVRSIVIDRSQTSWAVLDLESLIESDHPARAIWELSGRLDLSRFEEGVLSREGVAGRPCWPARLLFSIWIYGYTQGVASARALARMMRHEPGLRWLAADNEINHHTLADFRVSHQEALEQVLEQFLALLNLAGLVDLTSLLQDGTKVRARAGKASLHRRTTLEKRARDARKVIRKLDREAREEEAQDARREAARRRAAREALARAEAALAKLALREAEKTGARREQVRVSLSEADARKMAQPDGGWAPSYNVQVVTEAKSGMIVETRVSGAGNDLHELLGPLREREGEGGPLPERVIADAGYATRENVEGCAALGVELIAPWKDDAAREKGACARNGIDERYVPSAFRRKPGGWQLGCPQGKVLSYQGTRLHHGVRQRVYEASAADCAACVARAQCRGQREGPRRIERPVETQAMQAYQARMKGSEAKAMYRMRARIAEYPHLWAKAVKGWRRFSVRGLVKAGMEALWVALAFNTAQWMRLRPKAEGAAVTA
jgi:transposase